MTDAITRGFSADREALSPPEVTVRNAQANDRPPKSGGIRNETLLSLPQEYFRNRSKRLTNQKYVLSGFVVERLPPQIGDGQFPSYVTEEPLADCVEILLWLKGF